MRSPRATRAGRERARIAAGAGTGAQAGFRSPADTEPVIESPDLLPELDVPMLSEIIDGPVAPLDRVHAFDVLRAICRRAPRPVCSARARLTSVPLGGATPLAIAEAMLVLDGGLVVCAGSEATTMRDAVDDVAARLRRRLANIARRAPQPLV
jgi:hypothetical protein